MKFIIIVFAIGILIRVLVRYILPVFRITSMANEQMRRMQEQMKDMEQRNNQQSNPNPVRPGSKKEGDYIDYEEVR